MTPLATLVEASAQVAATRSRKQKAARLAALLATLAPDEVVPAVAWLIGEARQGKLGVGWALLGELREAHAATPQAPGAPPLTVHEVDAVFDELAGLAGKGSAGRRRERLAALFARASAGERDFLARVLLGELRQGGLDGIMAEAVAVAANVPADAVRRAQMLAGDLPAVTAAALADGAAGLARFALELFRPVEPMLATPCEGPAEALAAFPDLFLEWKLDGARVQAHKDADEARVFTRGLLDVTAQVPEVVAATRALPCRRAVLDGEAIALREDDRPRPFQETMSRFSRGPSNGTPLTVFFFDVLVVDDTVLLDRPLAERLAALAALVPAAHRVPRLRTGDLAAAEAFLADALARGHEGAMAKDPAAPYQVGSRGASWLKLKRAHTLDLVVLAVERGSGRRRGFLSNLHLGARDPASGGFVMLGKTFKGMTDELLAWQTRELGARAVRDDGHVVEVRPELVVEIAFDGVQASPHYPGGLALRFARVKGYRPDKRPDEADTIDTVRKIFAASRGEHGA
jgi:DNA ligase-1